MNDSGKYYRNNKPVISSIEQCLGLREEPKDRYDWRVWERNIYVSGEFRTVRIGFYQISARELWIDPNVCIGGCDVPLAIHARVGIVMHEPGLLNLIILAPARWVMRKAPDHKNWISLLEQRFREKYELSFCKPAERVPGRFSEKFSKPVFGNLWEDTISFKDLGCLRSDRHSNQHSHENFFPATKGSTNAGQTPTSPH